LVNGGFNIIEYEMSVNDRLVILSLLPETGNLLEMRLVNDFVEEIGFSNDEQEELDMKIEVNKIRWNKEKERIKKIIISDEVRELIMRRIIELDKKGMIDVNVFSVIKKFDLIPKEVM